MKSALMLLGDNHIAPPMVSATGVRAYVLTEAQLEALVQRAREDVLGRRFPILGGDRRRTSDVDWPRSIPWALIEPQAQQAKDNHDQTLERLAERGGLSPSEAVAVLRGRSLTFVREVPDEIACVELNRRVAEYETRRAHAAQPAPEDRMDKERQ